MMARGELNLNGQSLGNVLLAGGLGADNCVEAAQTGCAGLDFNSAVAIMAISKTIAELERIGDVAEKICKTALEKFSHQHQPLLVRCLGLSG